MSEQHIQASCAVAILAKAPYIGQVKTRLTPYLSDRDALRVHLWCVDTLTRVTLSDLLVDRRSLYVTELHPFWSSLPADLKIDRQAGDHLGARMLHALCKTFEQLLTEDVHHPSHPHLSQQDAVILLGTDSPTLSVLWLNQGLEWLQASASPRVVIGPAEDGGYYTIGCNRAALTHIQPLFTQSIPWGTERVLNETINALNQLPIATYLLPTWFDLDRPTDLERVLQDEYFGDSLRERLSPHPLSTPTDPMEAEKYHHALDRIFSLTRFGERMDLSAPRAINQALGDPLSTFRHILIGGTNGKGSTSAALQSIGQQLGLRVGVFNSPHLISFRERIRIGDQLISHEDVILGVETIFNVADRERITLSFFEAAWALAAWYFCKSNVEWVIWEVGLGGRLDATNCCEPDVSAIVSISFDHTHILGSTLDAIAAEKAPIFRPKRPALTACTGEALDCLKRYSPPQLRTIDTEYQQLEEEWLPLSSDSPLLGYMADTEHGRTNLALAYGIAREAGWIEASSSHTHLPQQWWQTITWAGRLELLEDIWLDCAHNPDAAQRIVDWLSVQKSQHPERPRHVFVGMSADKDLTQVLTLLSRACERITLVSPQYPRCLSAPELFEHYPKAKDHELRSDQNCEVIIASRIDDALRGRNLHALNLVTGSCFLIGEARAWLLGLPFPEGGIISSAR